MVAAETITEEAAEAVALTAEAATAVPIGMHAASAEVSHLEAEEAVQGRKARQQTALQEGVIPVAHQGSREGAKTEIIFL